MDRMRRAAAARRLPHAADSTSPRSPSDVSLDRPSPSSPIATHASQSPKSTASSLKRPFHKNDFEAKPRLARAASYKHNFVATTPTRDDHDEDGPEKGGHSLRKRARVNYATEQIEDEVVVPNSTSSASRAKKRKVDSFDDFAAIYGPRQKKRGVSLGADTPNTRRRNPSRKSTEIAAYREDIFENDDANDDNDVVDDDDDDDDDHDDDIQDTIEVGLSQSDISDQSIDNIDDEEPEAEEEPTTSTPTHQTLQKPDPEPTPTGINAHTTKTEDAPKSPVSEAKPALDDLAKGELPGDLAKDEGQDQSADPTQQLHDESAKSLIQATETTTAESHTSPLNLESPKLILAPSQVTPTKHQDDAVNNNSISSQPEGHETTPVTDKDTKDEIDIDHHEPLPVSPAQPTECSEPKPDPKKEEEEEVLTKDESHPTEEPEAIDEQRASTSQFIADNAQLTNEVAKTSNDDKPSAASPEVNAQDNIDTGAPKTQSRTASPVPPQQDPEPTVELSAEPTTELSAEPTIEPAAEPAAELDANPALVPEADSVAEPITEPVAEPITEPVAEPIAEPVVEPVVDSQPVELTNAAETDAAPQKTDSEQRGADITPVTAPGDRWAHLTPYLEGEYTVYPEKTGRADEDDASEVQSQEDKDASKDANEVPGMVDENEEAPDSAAIGTGTPTPAPNSPPRASPVQEALEVVAQYSLATPGEEPEEAESSESQEPQEKVRHFRYRKLRDPEEFIAALEGYEGMSTDELFQVMELINGSLVKWQDEWSGLGKTVDDYENSSRRLVADVKYEARTRNHHQHGMSYEEPDFVVKGYKAKEKEGMSETRYLQSQDRTMAATYGFDYDPHPSKIGRQNPATQQAGVNTRGRSLRNQPRQTAKATEADGATGKRQRKPVQMFDLGLQDISRSSTPLPGRGRRRRNANAENDEAQVAFTSSFNTEPNSDVELTPAGRRKRGTRGKAAAAPRIVEDFAPAQAPREPLMQDGKPGGRRGRPKSTRVDEVDTVRPSIENEPQSEPRRRHLLTLKIPKGTAFSEPSSAITDNGESRPSTASSDSTTHTVESSYSLRPKRQKRFRDEPDHGEDPLQAPPKKRNRRAGPGDNPAMDDVIMKGTETAQNGTEPRKPAKIKIMRQPQESRNDTPMSQATTDGGDDQAKEYRAMTKSEKMSASMKSRWANGNMAGAVEKRKATLAAKKAAQVAAEQRVGPIAPKPKNNKPGKKDSTPAQGENPTFGHDQQYPPPQQHEQVHMQPGPQQHPHPHQQHPHGSEYPRMGVPFQS